MTEYTLPAGKVLVLRTSSASGRSSYGFQWPMTGPVSEPTGHGLYGLLWGHGDSGHLLFRGRHRPLWQVVEVPAGQIEFIHQASKVRYQTGLVLLSTHEQAAAVDFLNQHRPHQVPVVAVRPALPVNWHARFMRSCQAAVLATLGLFLAVLFGALPALGAAALVAGIGTAIVGLYRHVEHHAGYSSAGTGDASTPASTWLPDVTSSDPATAATLAEPVIFASDEPHHDDYATVTAPATRPAVQRADEPAPASEPTDPETVDWDDVIARINAQQQSGGAAPVSGLVEFLGTDLGLMLIGVITVLAMAWAMDGAQ